MGSFKLLRGIVCLFVCRILSISYEVFLNLYFPIQQDILEPNPIITAKIYIMLSIKCLKFPWWYMLVVLGNHPFAGYHGYSTSALLKESCKEQRVGPHDSYGSVPAWDILRFYYCDLHSTLVIIPDQRVCKGGTGWKHDWLCQLFPGSLNKLVCITKSQNGWG